MPAQLEKPRDILGGVVVVAIGVGFLLQGRELETGTAARMGPGYFPTVLSCLMIALGAALALLALRKPGEEGWLGRVPWAGILLVVGAVVFFGLTLRGLGLAPSVLAVVLATAWASRYASVRASVPLALGLAVFCVVLFTRLLGLPLPAVGPWLSPAHWSRPASAPPSAAAPPAATPTAPQ
jgi:uncharacterized membrane protein YgdD (TMEM256/DUF423 family)